MSSDLPRRLAHCFSYCADVTESSALIAIHDYHDGVVSIAEILPTSEI